MPEKQGEKQAEKLVAAVPITVDGVEKAAGDSVDDCPAGNVAAMVRLGQAIPLAEWQAAAKQAAVQQRADQTAAALK